MPAVPREVPPELKAGCEATSGALRAGPVTPPKAAPAKAPHSLRPSAPTEPRSEEEPCRRSETEKATWKALSSDSTEKVRSRSPGGIKINVTRKPVRTDGGNAGRTRTPGRTTTPGTGGIGTATAGRRRATGDPWQAEHKEEHNDAKLKKKKELMGFHVGSDQDSYINYEECCKAFKRILGASNDMPSYRLKERFAAPDERTSSAPGEEIFDELDVLGKQKLDFRQFHKLAAEVSQYMADNPKWRKEEEDKEEKETYHEALPQGEEKQKQERRRERAKSDASDVFAILGIAKSKDCPSDMSMPAPPAPMGTGEAEQKKDQAITRATAAKDMLKAAGEQIVDRHTQRRATDRAGAVMTGAARRERSLLEGVL
eukprot:g16832.t1